MSNQQIRPSSIALLVSASIIIFASVGGEGAPRDEDIAPDEVTTSDEAFAFPETLSNVEHARGIPNYGYNVGTAAFYNAITGQLVATYVPPGDPSQTPPEFTTEALMDSLSPGVRTSYRAWLWDRADAQAKEREREAAERERDEAEYAVFIEEHLRRLNTGRRSKK